jgi:nucleoside-diphosphate-sugar epimerase
LEFVEGDLRVPDSLDSAVEGVDVVFHTAGVIHTKRIRDLYAINAQGTRNLLVAAAKKGVRRVVYVSSNSVGGFTRDGRLMRECDPPRPHMAYGHSKLLAEQAVKRFVAEGKLEGIILRPCWFYGPGQPERQTRFFRMIKQGRPIIFGDGTNLRSMSYLDNTIQGMLLAEMAPRAKGQTYWIADERPYPTMEIYRTVAELFDVKEFRPRHVPGLASKLCSVADWFIQKLGLYEMTVHVGGEMNKHIACSVEKARKELGYSPKIGLREGVRRSIEWCRRTGVEL